jgi:SSS family solute:Na+ symporter
MVMEEDPEFVPNKRFKLDMFNVVLGIIVQCCLTLLPMYIILWMKLPSACGYHFDRHIIAVILKRTWWNKLED